MRRSTVFLAAGLLAGALIGGSIGAVVGATAIPTIKACVEKDGTMRYLSSGNCKAGEKLLSWNVQGVPGAKGATGPSGPAGTAPGASYYLATFDKTQPNVAPTISVFDLPMSAGDYLVDLEGVADTSDGSGAVTCHLEAGGHAVLHQPGPALTIWEPIHVSESGCRLAFFCSGC
jgi:hypothetical protein